MDAKIGIKARRVLTRLAKPITNMASSATIAVQTTPEIISLILGHLPPRDLLVSAQRVSRTRYNIIKTTPLLQETLFFRPSPPSDSETINPLLRLAFPPWFEASINYFDMREWPKASHFRTLQWVQRPSAFAYALASWRKMILVTGGPVVTSLKVTEHESGTAGDYVRHGVLECKDGLRMGVLWDMTKEWCTFDEDARFLVKWRANMMPGEFIELTLFNSPGCVMGMLPPALGREFQSGGAEETCIVYGNWGLDPNWDP